MSDLAEASGVSTSMLSRIVNGNYSKPIAIDILQKLAKCAPQGCQIDFEDLLECNGMISKERAAQMSPMERRRQRMLEERNRRREMREIITDNLFARGIAIKKLGSPNQSETKPSKIFEDVRFMDLTITLPEKEHIEGSFIMLSAVREEDNSYKDAEHYIKRVIEINAIIFLQDVWEPENLTNNKISFVFADELYFKMFKSALEKAKINNRMSAILLDINRRKVKKEHIFPCLKFVNEESIFDLPINQDSDKEEYRQLSFFDGFLGNDDNRLL